MSTSLNSFVAPPSVVTITIEELDKVLLSPTVSRGDLVLKRGGGAKLYPSYETKFKYKHAPSPFIYEPYVITKSFDDYRELYNQLTEGCRVEIPIEFPPSFTLGKFGLHPDEGFLSNRCYMLDNWINVVCSHAFTWPENVQVHVYSFFELTHVERPQEEFIKHLLECGRVVRRDLTTNSPILSPSSKEKIAARPFPMQRRGSLNYSSDAGKLGGGDDNASEINLRNNLSKSQSLMVGKSNSVLTSSNIAALNDNNRRNSTIPSTDPIKKVETFLPLDKDTSTNDVKPIFDEILANFLLPEPLMIHDKLRVSVDVVKGLKNKRYKFTITIAIISSINHANLGSINKTEAFNVFRDFDKTLRDKHGVHLTTDFPATLNKTKLGLALNKDELTDRATKLLTWVHSLFQQYCSFHTSVKEFINSFFQIEDTYSNKVCQQILFVINSPDNASAVTPPHSNAGVNRINSPDNASAVTPPHSNAGLNNEKSHSLSLTPPKSRGNVDVPSYVDNKPFLIAEKLFVSVNFGEIRPKNSSDKYLHVTYKTEFFVKDSVRFGNSTPFDVTYSYASYAALYSGLKRLGVYPGSKYNICRFPRKHYKNGVGIALSIDELIDRCKGIHNYATCILSVYASLPSAAQSVIDDFFDLDADDVNNQFAGNIITILRSNTTASNRTDTTDAFTPTTADDASRDSFETSVTKLYNNGFRKSDLEDNFLGYTPCVLFGSKLESHVSLGPLKKVDEDSGLSVLFRIKIKVIMNEPNLLSTLTVCYSLKQLRKINNDLKPFGIGKGLQFDIAMEFPSDTASTYAASLHRASLETSGKMLNFWLAALLNQFHKFPIAAQNYIINFLQLDPEDKSNQARNKVIIAILKEETIPSYLSSTSTLSKPVSKERSCIIS